MGFTSNNKPYKPIGVPNSRKTEIARQLEPVKEVERRKGTCLFIVDEKGQRCRNPVENNCHVIPESSVLKDLKDPSSGKVYELQWGVARWGHFFAKNSETNSINRFNLDAFAPQLVGTKNACVGRFACKSEDVDHDSEFSPIDVIDPDFDDPIVRLLYMYRVTLGELNLLSSCNKLVARYNKQVRTHSNTELRAKWHRLLMILTKTTPWLEATASRLGNIWYNYKKYGDMDASLISTQVLSFRSSLRFAACGLYGKGIVIVLPVEEHRHKLCVLYFPEDDGSAKEHKERLIRLSRMSEDSCDHGVGVLEEILKSGWGALAASPESYRKLPEREKRTIKGWVAHNSGADTIEKSLATQHQLTRV